MVRRLATVDEDGVLRPGFKVPESALPTWLTEAELNASYASSAAILKRAGLGREQVYNNTGSSLRRLRAAQARSKAGGAPVNVWWKGDSIIQSTVSAPFNRNAIPARVHSYLEARHGYYGSGMNFLLDVDSQDTRWTRTGTWTRLANKGVVGGFALTTTTTGSTATFTDDCDRITVYYLITADGATDNSYSWNGAAAVSFSSQGTEAVGSFTVTAARGTNTLVLTSGTGRFTPLAVDVRVGTTGGYRLCKAAFAGQKVSSFTGSGTPGSPLTLSETLAAPDVTFIPLETNDYANGGTSLATYRAGLVTLITSAQLTGDVVLIATPTPRIRWGQDGTPGTGDDIPLNTTPTLADYTAVLYELADTYNTALIDLQVRWGTWTEANAAGLMADDYHPSNAGNWDYAHAVYEAVFQQGYTPEAMLGIRNTWTERQTFGRTGTSDKVTLGSWELAPVPTTPYLLGTNAGNLYYGAPGSGKFVFLQSDHMTAAGKKFKSENGNLPALDADGFIRIKPITTASRPTAATAGKGAVLYDDTLGFPIYSDGTNWKKLSDDTTV